MPDPGGQQRHSGMTPGHHWATVPWAGQRCPETGTSQQTSAEESDGEIVSSFLSGTLANI